VAAVGFGGDVPFLGVARGRVAFEEGVANPVFEYDAVVLDFGGGGEGEDEEKEEGDGEEAVGAERGHGGGAKRERARGLRRMSRGLLGAEGGGDAGGLVGAVGDAGGDLGVGDGFAGEGGAGGVNETRDDHGAEIEHETVGERHDAHVAARTAGGAEEARDFIFPAFAGEFDEVLEGGVGAVVVNRRRDDDAVGGGDEGVHAANVFVFVGLVAVAERKRVVAEIEEGDVAAGVDENAPGFAGEGAAVALGIEAGGNDQEIHGEGAEDATGVDW